MRYYVVAARLMCDKLESFKKLEDTNQIIHPNTTGTSYSSRNTSRPDAVSTFLIDFNRVELYGVQQLSNAVKSLEEEQKR